MKQLVLTGLAEETDFERGAQYYLVFNRSVRVPVSEEAAQAVIQLLHEPTQEAPRTKETLLKECDLPEPEAESATAAPSNSNRSDDYGRPPFPQEQFDDEDDAGAPQV